MRKPSPIPRAAAAAVALVLLLLAPRWASSRGETTEAARTIFWSHLDALPKAPLWGAVEPIEVRRRTGPVDGRWAVAMEGSRVQVFDIAGRRELGHVDLPPRQAILGVHLLAEEGVLMVQLFDSDEPGASGHLRAFAIKAAR